MMKDKNTALLLVDLQNDFCPGGALAVEEGDQVIAIANRLMPYFHTVIATQDWHPSHHKSFASQHSPHRAGDIILLHQKPQILWPDHCVQHSYGAQFHPDLNQKNIHKIIQKGADPNVDSYSAFYDNHHLKNTGLTEWLRKKSILALYVMGLATDYCVQYTCLDAIQDHFRVHLVVDGCRGVNLKPKDTDHALSEMKNKGVQFVHSKDIL